MAEALAFAAILVSLVGFPAGAYVLARRGPRPAAIAIALGLAGLAAMLLARYRPDAVAWAIGGTDAVLLYPAIGGAPATALLVALALRTTPRNRRSVLVFAVVVGAYSAWEAAWLVRDPAAGLAQAGRGGWVGDVYHQSTPWSCAPAASCSLLRHIGVPADETEMARLMHSRPRYGTFDLNMQLGLARKLAPHGFRAVLRRPSYDELVAARAPALASVRYLYPLGHAVAVIAADADGVTVLDPSSGRGRMSRKDFEEVWHGMAIFVEREPAKPASGS